MKIVRDSWGWRERIIALIILALVYAFLCVIVTHAGSGGDPLPQSLKVTAPVKYVNCGLGCCCGEVTVTYRGHYYGNPSYCRWFRPDRDWPTLTEGQNVTATVRLVR